jgi:hypothetical protein
MPVALALLPVDVEIELRGDALKIYSVTAEAISAAQDGEERGVLVVGPPMVV